MDGTYLVDSRSIRLHVDSAHFWLVDSSEVEHLGGIAAALGQREGDSWQPRNPTAYVLVEQALSASDTLVVRGLDFVVSRSGIRDVSEHWLVFSLAMGGMRGQMEVEPLGFRWARTDREVFSQIRVPLGRHPIPPPEAGMTFAKLIPGSCRREVGVRIALREFIPVHMVIDTLGRVERGSVASSDSTLPSQALKRAVDYVETCRFTPGVIDGRKVRHAVATTLLVGS